MGLLRGSAGREEDRIVLLRRQNPRVGQTLSRRPANQGAWCLMPGASGVDHDVWQENSSRGFYSHRWMAICCPDWVQGA